MIAGDPMHALPLTNGRDPRVAAAEFQRFLEEAPDPAFRANALAAFAQLWHTWVAGDRPPRYETVTELNPERCASGFHPPLPA